MRPTAILHDVPEGIAIAPRKTKIAAAGMSRMREVLDLEGAGVEELLPFDHSCLHRAL
jgi:hypothetical protein